MINLKKAIIVLTTIILIISTYLFSKTNGLVDGVLDEFVSLHMSGDSDDNVCIEIGLILYMPYIFNIFTIKKRIYTWEYIVENLIILLQFLMLIAIEGGSVIKTIKLGNCPLLCWTISYILLFLEVNIFFIYERIKIHTKLPTNNNL